jgi:hypothetical protein
MHCQSDDPIPLKDINSETEQERLKMDFPLLARKKAQQFKIIESAKKVHAAIVPNDNDM